MCHCACSTNTSLYLQPCPVKFYTLEIQPVIVGFLNTFLIPYLHKFKNYHGYEFVYHFEVRVQGHFFQQELKILLLAMKSCFSI